jgi:regulatory protein
MTKPPSPSRAEQTEREGLEHALQALEHRERSTAQVDRYLAERGVERAVRDEILETLARTSLIDDRRFAESRAVSLAERGAGDTRIRYELARAGIEGGIADDVLAAIPPELDRAQAIIVRRGMSAKTARYLAGKGFAEDTIHAVVARLEAEPLG